MDDPELSIVANLLLLPLVESNVIFDKGVLLQRIEVAELCNVPVMVLILYRLQILKLLFSSTWQDVRPRELREF